MVVNVAPTPSAQAPISPFYSSTIADFMASRKGSQDKGYLRLQKQISDELMNIRFTAKAIERLCDSVRGMVEEVRRHEREIINLCVNKGQMPRPHRCGNRTRPT